MKETEFLELLTKIRINMAGMSDQQRVELVDEIMAGYCSHCGSAHLPCYCQHDE